MINGVENKFVYLDYFSFNKRNIFSGLEHVSKINYVI